jgi:hypothetical protein
MTPAGGMDPTKEGGRAPRCPCQSDRVRESATERAGGAEAGQVERRMSGNGGGIESSVRGTSRVIRSRRPP